LKRGVAVLFSLRSLLAFFCLFTGFQSPVALAITLAQAEQELLRANPDIAIARANIEGAVANVTVQGAHPNPTLSVQTAHFSPLTGLGAGRPHDKALDTIVGISLPIERGDKAALRREAALEQLAGVRLDLSETRRQQRLALHQAYFDLKLAEDKLAITREMRDLALQALGAADKRVAAGDIAEVDRVRLQVDALRTANDATAAEADVRQARVALAAAMGRTRIVREDAGAIPITRVEAPLDDLATEDAWPVLAGDVVIDDALAMIPKRADVAGAEARVAAANAARAVARSLRTRDVTVGAQIERDPTSSPGVTYGISVSIPLYARYGYEGEIAKAEADYSTAVLTRVKVLTQAEAEIGKTHAMLANARARLRNFESDLVPTARKALDAIEFAYSRGAASLTDVLDARRTWRTVLTDLAQARSDHAKALAAWSGATQWEIARP